MKIYISGPMTGYPAFNAAAFNAAAVQLLDLGHEVFNPADLGADPAKTWSDYLRDDIALLVLADAVAVLPGWEASRGAALEVHVAHQLGMTVLPIHAWTPAP